MKTSYKIFWGFLGVSLVGSILLVAMSIFSFGVLLSGDLNFDYNEKRNHLVQLDITGPIIESEPQLNWIDKIKKNKSCKGVLVRINSPGGSASASQEIFHALQEINANIPVVVSLGNVAASGGYYIALAGKKIFANPSTITGSIGVIAQFPNAGELFKKVGISMSVVKTGKYKDVGSMYRKSTKDEMKYIQEMIDNTFHQFKTDVSESRGLEMDEVAQLAEGKVYTGEQAMKAGLLDTLGGYLEAKDYLSQLADLGEDPIMVGTSKKQGFMEKVMNGSRVEKLVPMESLKRLIQPGVYYLWPGALGM